jgi:hypothetical protein
LSFLPPLTAEEELVDFLHHGIGIQFDDSGCPLPELDFQEADLQVREGVRECEGV